MPGLLRTPVPGEDPNIPFWENVNLYLRPEHPWYMKNILVFIKDIYDDDELVGQTGIIRNISGNKCFVFLPDKNRHLSIYAAYLEPVCPKIGDKCIVMHGEYRQYIGKLLSRDGEDGLVEFSFVSMKMPLSALCKVPNN